MTRRLLAIAWLLLVVLVLWHRVLPHLDGTGTSFPGYWTVGRLVLDGVPAIQLYDDAWLGQQLAAHRDRP